MVAGSVRMKSAAAAAYPASLAHSALDRLVAALGNNVTALLLDLDPGQVSRWRRGDRIATAAAGRLMALDYLLSRLLQTFYPEDAAEWLSSPSPFLYGGRPVDVLSQYGLAPVLNALAAVEQGAYA